MLLVEARQIVLMPVKIDGVVAVAMVVDFVNLGDISEATYQCLPQPDINSSC